MEAVLSYLALVKSMSPQQWIFAELMKMDEFKFRFLTKQSPHSFVTDAVDRMHVHSTCLVPSLYLSLLCKSIFG